jgi:hypothetical protein
MNNSPAASGSSAMDDTQAATLKPQRGRAPKAPKAPKTPKVPKTPKPKRTPGRASGCLGAILNLLTLVFVLGTCLSATAAAVLFQYPGVLRFVRGGSAYLPPTDPAIAQVLVTPMPLAGTAGPRFPTLPPVWTATDTPTITATPAPGTPSQEPSATQAVPTYTATWTAMPTATSTKPSPTPTKNGPTPKPTNTRSATAFNLQTGSPTYLSNFLNTSGCNWFGIVGRAFGLDGNPVINLTVHLEGGGISADVVTGSGPSALGPGGYQIPIADHPIDTTDTYHIILRNNSGTPLSDTYAIRTFGDCAKNTVMVNFTQNHSY